VLDRGGEALHHQLRDQHPRRQHDRSISHVEAFARQLPRESRVNYPRRFDHEAMSGQRRLASQQSDERGAHGDGLHGAGQGEAVRRERVAETRFDGAVLQRLQWRGKRVYVAGEQRVMSRECGELAVEAQVDRRRLDLCRRHRVYDQFAGSQRDYEVDVRQHEGVFLLP
jgi:hypothetical protein